MITQINKTVQSNIQIKHCVYNSFIVIVNINLIVII